MHICFASLDYPDETGGGGVGTYVQTMGRELIRQGHRVSVVALKKGASPDTSEDRGVQIHWFRPGNVHWYVSKLPFLGKMLALPIRELEYSGAVVKAVREIDRKDPVDIVEGIETGACEFRRLRRGIKTVIRLHGERYTFAKYTPPGHIPIDVKISRYLQRKAFLSADGLTAPSNAHADEIRNELRGKDLSIAVVPNPLKIHLPERSTLDTGHPLFLFVGRLQRVKGVLDLLKAAPLILSRVPGARFIFAGSPHPSIPTERIESLIDEAGISGKVGLPGHVDGVKLAALYQEAAAVVLPSYYETFGYAHLEALMTGAPVVAFDSGSAKNFIVDGKNGFLVPVGDVDALAAACVAAIDLRMSMPEKGDFSKYMPAQVCKEMISIYDNLFLSH